MTIRSIFWKYVFEYIEYVLRERDMFWEYVLKTICHGSMFSNTYLCSNVLSLTESQYISSIHMTIRSMFWKYVFEYIEYVLRERDMFWEYVLKTICHGSMFSNTSSMY